MSMPVSPRSHPRPTLKNDLDFKEHQIDHPKGHQQPKPKNNRKRSSSLSPQTSPQTFPRRASVPSSSLNSPRSGSTPLPLPNATASPFGASLQLPPSAVTTSTTLSRSEIVSEATPQKNLWSPEPGHVKKLIDIYQANSLTTNITNKIQVKIGDLKKVRAAQLEKQVEPQIIRENLRDAIDEFHSEIRPNLVDITRFALASRADLNFDESLGALILKNAAVSTDLSVEEGTVSAEPEVAVILVPVEEGDVNVKVHEILNKIDDYMESKSTVDLPEPAIMNSVFHLGVDASPSYPLVTPPRTPVSNIHFSLAEEAAAVRVSQSMLFQSGSSPALSSATSSPYQPSPSGHIQPRRLSMDAIEPNRVSKLIEEIEKRLRDFNNSLRTENLKNQTRARADSADIDARLSPVLKKLDPLIRKDLREILQLSKKANMSLIYDESLGELKLIEFQTQLPEHCMFVLEGKIEEMSGKMQQDITHRFLLENTKQPANIALLEQMADLQIDNEEGDNSSSLLSRVFGVNPANNFDADESDKKYSPSTTRAQWGISTTVPTSLSTRAMPSLSLSSSGSSTSSLSSSTTVPTSGQTTASSMTEREFLKIFNALKNDPEFTFPNEAEFEYKPQCKNLIFKLALEGYKSGHITPELSLETLKLFFTRSEDINPNNIKMFALGRALAFWTEMAEKKPLPVPIVSKFWNSVKSFFSKTDTFPELYTRADDLVKIFNMCHKNKYSIKLIKSKEENEDKGKIAVFNLLSFVDLDENNRPTLLYVSPFQKHFRDFTINPKKSKNIEKNDFTIFYETDLESNEKLQLSCKPVFNHLLKIDIIAFPRANEEEQPLQECGFALTFTTLAYLFLSRKRGEEFKKVISYINIGVDQGHPDDPEIKYPVIEEKVLELLPPKNATYLDSFFLKYYEVTIGREKFNILDPDCFDYHEKRDVKLYKALAGPRKTEKMAKDCFKVTPFYIVPYKNRPNDIYIINEETPVKEDLVFLVPFDTPVPPKKEIQDETALA